MIERITVATAVALSIAFPLSFRSTEHRRAPLESFIDEVTEAAEENGVPPLLLWSVIHAESNFNPTAVSRKRAIGLAQVLPTTAARFGRNVYNPHDNIWAAAEYLGWLKQNLGRWEWAIAAYNCGETHPGVRARDFSRLPPETYNYVKYVIKLWRRWDALEEIF